MTLAWTVEQAAAFHSDAGSRVLDTRGVLWLGAAAGFYRPVDYLRPIPPQSRPTRRALGCHHVTDDEQATTYLPLKVVPNVAQLTQQQWSRNLRRDIRACRSQAAVEQAADPYLLLAQGYRVWTTAAARTGQMVPASEVAFRRLIEARWTHGPQIAIVGHRDGRLGGFLLAHVIGDSMYADQLVVGDEGLSWRLGSSLYLHGLTMARGLGAQTAFVGFWEPELPGLVRFKAGLGARVVATPAHADFLPAVGGLLRKLYPRKSIRLAGRPREVIDAMGERASTGT